MGISPMEVEYIKKELETVPSWDKDKRLRLLAELIHAEGELTRSSIGGSEELGDDWGVY